MKMEELQNELDEARSTTEKLIEELRVKSVLAETLRRSNQEQLAQIQEARSEIAKQGREIDAKAEEILITKQLHQDLRSELSQKELAIKQLRVANESMKNGFKQEEARWEARNKELVLTLDEANAERGEQKRTMVVHREEIDRLKSLLLLYQKKCADAESRAKAPKELSRRDDMLVELEQEKGRVEEKLKWKNERFRHLEDAYGKIQVEFRGAKKERELERSNMLDEINRLQMDLDSQSRVADELRSQLQMCNQALAHEESRRKLLEIGVSESKALYDNVVMEYEGARSNIESLTKRRDEEIAALRNSLATKATLLKEAEFSRTHLELENQELKKGLKEFQEAQINEEDAASSLKNLQLKFRSLEQTHRDCSQKLKAREVEWTALAQKLREEMRDCLAKLISKDKQILQLELELEGICASLMQCKFESEVIQTVHIRMESSLLEYCAKLEKSKIELEQHCANIEGRFGILMEQMEKQNVTLVQAQADTKSGNDIIQSLEERIRNLGSLKQEYKLVQEELASYKQMFEESSRIVDCSRQQELNVLQEDLKKALVALSQTNCALAEKNSEVHKIKIELQQLRVTVEKTLNVRSGLEIELAKYCAENDELRKKMEVSILARVEAEKVLVEEKYRVTEELQRQKAMLQNDFSMREVKTATLAKMAALKEKTRLLEIADDLEKKIQCVCTKLEFMEHKYEEATTGTLMKLEQQDAMILALEREYTSSIETAIASSLAEKQFEIGAIHDTLERILVVHIIAELEIAFNRTIIDEMEEETSMLQQSLFAEENRSFELRDQISRLKAERLKEELERDWEKVQSENELKNMKQINGALEDQIIQLTLEREESVKLMRELCDLVGEVYQKDELLMKNWDRVVEKVKNEDEAALNFEGEDIPSYVKVDGGNCISLSRNTAGHNADRRLPLREYNS